MKIYVLLPYKRIGTRQQWVLWKDDNLCRIVSTPGNEAPKYIRVLKHYVDEQLDILAKNRKEKQ